jgi:hypothetical protein
MTIDLNTINVATIITIILAIAGGVVCIVQPSTLTFDQYLEQMKYLIGLVGIGRGIAAAKR